MLAAYLDEVAYLAVGVLDAGTGVSNVDEDAFGGLIVLALDCSTDREHEVGCLFFDVVVEG